MQNNYSATTVNDAFEREILILLRFLLEGTRPHKSALEIEPPISLDEIARGSHWLKRRALGYVGEGRDFIPSDCASQAEGFAKEKASPGS